MVLMTLTEGEQRFAQIARQIGGISDRMLAQTLEDLEADGLVDRKATPGAVAVAYSLTPLGEELAVHVGGLADWIETNLPTIQRRYKRKRGG